MASKTLAKPKGSLVVVSGANGYIASDVVEEFLKDVRLVVNGTLNALKAAAKEPSPEPVIDSNTRNGEAVKAAWAPPPYKDLQRKLDIYSASKMQGDLATWKFMKDEKPAFVLNPVLPNANTGYIVGVERQGYPTMAGCIKAVWEGFASNEELKFNLPQYPGRRADACRGDGLRGVRGERLFGFAHPFN